MDENRTRLEQPQQDAPKKRSLWPLLFLPMALLYHELLLHAFDRTILFWDTPLVYILLFSAAGGCLLSALVDILPRRAAHIVTYALCVFWTVLTCIEYCCKSYFKSYWGLSFITQMTGNVVGNFFSTMVEIILGRIVFILLSFVPLIALIVFAVGEAITVGLTSVWFAVGALGALIAAGFGAALWLQVVVFLALSGVTLLLVRPLAKKFLTPRYQATNADRVIGATALVTEEIDNLKGSGLVNISGQVWTARSAHDVVIQPGREVKVLRIEGVKVFVELL